MHVLLRRNRSDVTQVDKRKCRCQLHIQTRLAERLAASARIDARDFSLIELTMTIDNTLNTTTVVAGGTTLNIVGVPTQKDPSTGAVMRDDATMLHVDGDITSLSGPGQGVAAIQDNTALTITAAKDVTVTGDILYKTPPVTTTQNQIPGAPADTLI